MNLFPPYYAYCVLRVNPERQWEVCTGIEGRPVFALQEGRLAMLLTRVEAGFTAKPESLIEHSRVVQRAFASHTVLPFRFGTAFENEQQVRSLLVANRASFQDTISRLRGKAEMHARFLFNGPQPPANGLSADERRLLELLHVAQAKQVSKEALQPFEDEAEQHFSARPLSNGAWLVELAHLVLEDRVSDYRHVISELGRRATEFQVMLSGPWPPYHFLPSAIRIPWASTAYLYPGRRIGPSSEGPAVLHAQAAKA